MDSNGNALSQASTQITLSNPQAGLANIVSVLDVSNNGNGQDLEVSFTKPVNDTNCLLCGNGCKTNGR
ncbi:hypothetical protein KHA80_12650 [Anaerobacillus sp. HL2]|nr:hypothetical protein KHA80_12650 [Anaerobacillus sp. HL2]